MCARRSKRAADPKCRRREARGRPTSSASRATGALISTNVIGDISTGFAMPADGALERRLRGRFSEGAVSAFVSRHRHHESERALMPTSAANSFAESPLSFHRSTRSPTSLESPDPSLPAARRTTRTCRLRQERDSSNGYVRRRRALTSGPSVPRTAEAPPPSEWSWARASGASARARRRVRRRTRVARSGRRRFSSAARLARGRERDER